MFAPSFMKQPVFKIFLPVLVLAVLFSQVFIQTGCANIVPPEGGLRDSLPPVLVRATPETGTRNFAADRITLTFDEYVDLDDYMKNLVVSPLPDNTPTVNRKLNTVTIRLRDSLEANTTYSLDFGKAIKDVNEGNILEGFTYTFSTGSYMDSLEFEGTVLLAETGEIDSTLTVLLYREKDDSAVIKKRPRYITRVDGTGNFHFRNLSPGTYYVYALKDEGSYRYLSPKQLFAFADSAVQVGEQTEEMTLRAYVADEGKTGSTTTSTPAPAGGRGSRNVEKRLRFQTNLERDRQSLLDSLVLSFGTPLKTLDTAKIHFVTDTIFSPVAGYRWELDSTKQKLALHYNWKENTPYHLILEKDFATDTLGQQLLKGDTISFSSRPLAEYGKLSLRMRNLDLSKNPVLQFVQNGEIKKSFPLTGELLTQPIFEPGEYNLRVLYDSNKNGRWDPGIFFGKRQQPELVKPLTRKITVRPNWDDTIEIAL